MELEDMALQHGENNAFEVPSKHNPEPLIRFTAAGRSSEDSTPC